MKCKSIDNPLNLYFVQLILNFYEITTISRKENNPECAAGALFMYQFFSFAVIQ